MGERSAARPGGERLYLRQLLAGRDFAVGDEYARRMLNYVYAIGDRSTGEAVLVDPAYAPNELVELLGRDAMHAVGAVLTHYHADHAGGDLFGHAIAGVSSLLDLVDVPVHVQSDEVEWLSKATGLSPASFVAHRGGDILEIGGITVSLIHTPGHTPGSQCLLCAGQLVTGDTLFVDGCGRTDLPGGDSRALYDSLINTIGALPGSTTVLPGHAYSDAPSAELAALRKTNPVLAPLSEASWLAAFGR